MKTKTLAVLATSLSSLLFSFGALASDMGTMAALPGPGEGEVVTPGTPTTGCFFSYHIRKTGPAHADVGADVTYTIAVKNIGNCDLKKIKVTDFLPKHTDFQSSVPTAVPVDGKLTWEFDNLEENATATVTVTVKPKDRDCPHDVDRFFITNTGCAFSRQIGIRICDSATTSVDEDKNKTPKP